MYEAKSFYEKFEPKYKNNKNSKEEGRKSVMQKSFIFQEIQSELRELKDDTQRKVDFYIEKEAAESVVSKYSIDWCVLFQQENEKEVKPTYHVTQTKLTSPRLMAQPDTNGFFDKD